ncbi:MAG: S1C family serine protease [Limnochordia bacterium]|jgi:serine protease Do
MERKPLLWTLVFLGVFLASYLGNWLSPQPLAQPEEVVAQAPPWEETVIGIVEQVGPAVVKLVTTKEVLIDQFFFQVLQETEGVGSGFIFSPKGYILTNDHVIADARVITVFLPDGREYPGEIIGRDPLTDLAVVKIEGSDLPVVEFGDSDDLRVGQQVIAIGNPFRFDNSVTTGVVSALGRDISVHPQRDFDLTGMIQTDAAINPGNSGGPLLNGQGQVIGINTAVFQAAQGIGFAIPINLARDIADQLLEFGRVIRLGVIGGTLTPEVTKALEREGIVVGSDQGAYVLRVLPDTAAERAGLQSGDVIVELNGEGIDSIENLVARVEKLGIGSHLTINFLREGEPRQVEVVLE